MVTVSLCESDAPFDAHTKILTEYVPDGRLRITGVLTVAPAATIAVEVVTSNVCPAELWTTANTIAVVEVD